MERHARAHHHAVLDSTAVGDPDRASDCDDPIGVGGEHLDDSRQRVAVEQRVGVDDRDQLVAGEVQAGVQGIRAAAVALAGDSQARVRSGDVELLEQLGLEVEAIPERQLDQVEGVPQRGQRAVCGAVVDDHDLERVVVGAEQRAHRRHDHELLVVGGRNQADAGPKRPAQRPEQPAAFDLLLQLFDE